MKNLQNPLQLLTSKEHCCTIVYTQRENKLITLTMIWRAAFLLDAHRLLSSYNIGEFTRRMSVGAQSSARRDDVVNETNHLLSPRFTSIYDVFQLC